VTGADRSQQATPLTDKKEITGSEQAIKHHGAVVNLSVDGFENAFSNPSRLKRKIVIFAGRGVFFLDPPFNGRPPPARGPTPSPYTLISVYIFIFVY
jgi:hypothetical protein